METKEELKKFFSKKDFNERYKKIPDKIRNLLVDTQVGKIVRDSLKANRLDEKNFSIVMYLVGLVLIGFYHPDDFVKYLAKDIKVDSLAGQNAARQINREIFIPNKEELKFLYNLPLGSQSNIKNSSVEKQTKEKENSIDEGKIKKEGIGVDKNKFEPKIFPRNMIGSSVSNSNLKTESLVKKENNTKLSVDGQKIEKNQPRPTLIVGKETEIRPTLESAPAMTSVFDEVKSDKKETVISSLETGGHSVSENKSFFQSIKDKLSFKKKTSSSPQSIEKNKPTDKSESVSKIVNYSADNNIQPKDDDVKKEETDKKTEKNKDNIVDFKKIKF